MHNDIKINYVRRDEQDLILNRQQPNEISLEKVKQYFSRILKVYASHKDEMNFKLRKISQNPNGNLGTDFVFHQSIY